MYKKNAKWAKAVGLAKADRLWRDAMETAAASGSADIAEELLRFFVAEKARSARALRV